MLKKAQETTRLDKAIEELENAIIGGDIDTEQYNKYVANLEILHKLRSGHQPSKLEMKDWMPIVGSIGGILVIVVFEAFGHTLTSKSIGFVSKLKS